ncbi:MAG: hypothetical protein H0V82_01635 [Candidatus Protochlamydia sp.]|nr:hypothetical protein [Candidatus Protochlamydia sp.]
MNIHSALNDKTSYTEHSYLNFASLVENAYVELSFWGTRNVYAIGYTDCIYANWLKRLEN